MVKDPSSRRAAVILFALCVIAASAIAGAAAYRYLFWGDQLPGGFAASLADRDGDGAPEYLIAKALVDLPESGDYAANAVLLEPSSGAAVAQTSGRVELDRGANVFGIGFWGPDIRKSQVSGPYALQLTFIREQRDSLFERPASPDMVGRVYQWRFTTPAYDWRSFQEQPSPVEIAGPATSSRTDADGNGRADSFTINVPVTVRTAGFYSVRADSDGLFLQGVTDRFFPAGRPDLSRGTQSVQMAPGSQNLAVDLPADQIYLSGIDGPLDIHLTISDANQVAVVHPCCGTVDPSFSEAPAFAPPPDGSEFGLRPPYLLPPTPIGLRLETHVTEVVHWYDFQAPWMPIEFTGTVRDFGTDADGDGMFDALTLEAEVLVRNLGSYDLSGTLYVAGSEPSNEVLMRSTPAESSVVTTAWTRLQFNDWNAMDQPRTVRLDFAGAEILAAGRDGPFDAKLRMVPANVVIDPIVVHTTAAYRLSQFEATGAKAARLGPVEITNSQSGQFVVRVDAAGIGPEYTVITRIIHANGVVALDASFVANGVTEYLFTTDAARATDFAVAVYLMDASGVGVDYIEIPLAVG